MTTPVPPIPLVGYETAQITMPADVSNPAGQQPSTPPGSAFTTDQYQTTSRQFNNQGNYYGVAVIFMAIPRVAADNLGGAAQLIADSINGNTLVFNTLRDLFQSLSNTFGAVPHTYARTGNSGAAGITDITNDAAAKELAKTTALAAYAQAVPAYYAFGSTSLTGSIIRPILLSVVSLYNIQRLSVIAEINSRITAINTNPAVTNPVGYIDAQILALKAIADGGVATVMGVVAAVNAEVNRIKVGTVDPAVAQITGLIDAQVKFATAAVNSAVAQAMTAITNAQAEVNRQKLILEAEAERQKNAVTAAVTEEQRKAMLAIENAVTTALVVVGAAAKLAGDTAETVLGLAGEQLVRAQEQLRDRPLFYGTLSSPVTISGPTDVVVIPPGGLVITAD